jgi:Holliday junction resolvase RusA-like endonuclease
MMAQAIETAAVEFTVPGDIVPWARSGGGKTVVRFTPKRQRAYMAVLRDYAALAMRGRVPLDGPLELRLCAVYGWPQRIKPADRAKPGVAWKASKPDADNVQKILKDALNKIVWIDDARVASWHGWKLYGDRPRLEVKVFELGGTI